MLSLHFYNDKSIDFIKSLASKQYKQVAGAIFDLCKNPNQNDVIFLKGYEKEKLKRKDVGEFRVVFKHDETRLIIIVVGKRNDDDVYKLLRQIKG